MVDLLLLLLLDCLPSNLFGLSFQCLTRAKDQLGLRNGTIRNIGLQENRLEQLLFGANTQGYLFAQATVAGTKPLLKLGLLKPDSCAALELGVGVLHVVWRLGVGSARDAAGAVSVSEPRAHFGSSLLVLQHEFGG